MTKYRVGRDVGLKKENVRLADGKRLTEQLAEDAAKAVGRPSLTASGRRSPRVAVRLSQTIMHAVEEAARGEGRTISEVTRYAVQQYVSDSSTRGKRRHKAKAEQEPPAPKRRPGRRA
jgi:hypothetical protein